MIKNALQHINILYCIPLNTIVDLLQFWIQIGLTFTPDWFSQKNKQKKRTNL